MNQADQFVDRVERLLSDLDPDDRASLLADLRDQLTQSDDSALLLGTPEEFVAEYRRSAGLHVEARTFSMVPSEIVSILVLAFATLLLFSFGGQVVLGPVVLVIGWFLARDSSRWLRVAWTTVATLLSGELAYIFLARTDWDNRVYPLIGTLLVAGAVGLLFDRTTGTPPGPNHIPLAIMWAGGVAAATFLAASSRGDSPLPFVLVAVIAAAIGGWLMYARR